MKEKHNLVVNGSGNPSGGVYNKVKIRGEGTISDHIDCTSFKTHGSSSVEGNVKTNIFDVFGEAEVRGALHAESSSVYGNLEVYGDAAVKKAKVRGMMHAHQKLTSEAVDVKGSLLVQGNVEVEQFVSDGSFEINGMLNVGTIQVGIRYDNSTADEIGGEKITARRKFSFLPFTKKESFLVARIIEGDEIDLEYTKAQLVRGNKVRIGPGCEIELVEYHEGYQNTSQSVVKEYKKI
ncbi:hypothetical protein ACFDTO_29635 [Microbacteriaceae bacterium 4G12]